MARTVRINAKCSDMCSFKVPHLDIDHDGNIPGFANVGGGDYIRFELDLDTGKIVGFEPVTDESIKDEMAEY